MDKLEQTIGKLKKVFEPSDFIMAFSGGIGIDGFLNKITREHEDIDIDVFGRVERKFGLKELEQIISQYHPKFNGLYFEFQLDEIKIEIGYVQILKESETDFSYDAGDGVFSTSMPLFLLKIGRINNLTFDIFNPVYSIAEKVMLPILNEKEYRQKDISDLNHLLKKVGLKDVQTALFERYKFKDGSFVDVGMP